MKKYTRARAEIDLNAIKHNINALHHSSPSAKMIAVVKADGYGHGAVQIAKIIEDNDYLWGFAVATADEGLVLRKAGIKAPILVLGASFPEQYEEIISNDIRFCIYQEEEADKIADVANQMGKPAKVHIKIDTGMGRIGFPANDEGVESIKRVLSLSNLVPEGLFTHFSKADETDKTYTNSQIEKYNYVSSKLKDDGIKFKFYHCSNSAGIIDRLGSDKDLVRAGIAMYGLRPSRETEFDKLDLFPAMSFKSSVIYVKTIEAGTSISYGGLFTSDQSMRVATIPIGYADGYPRSLSNKGYVLIHGKRASILGRVCMDQMIVDVTNIPEAKFGDEVVLIGTSGEETIYVDDFGDLSGRFNYEFVCDITKRVPREYILDGEVIHQVDWF